jgi:hypothetical protein
MNLADWDTTSTTTNIGEAAHRHAQLDGTRLSLLAAVQRGRKLDLQLLQLEHASLRFGVSARYGNTSYVGRGKRAIDRQRVKATKKAMKARTLEMATEEQLEG